jgi:membrane-associated phospholipid phosphatase
VARSPRTPLLLAAGCAAGFVVLLALAYGSDGARWVDATSLQGFVDLQETALQSLSERVAQLGDPAEVGLIAAALAAVALARGRPRLALAVIVLLALTSVSSQLLKAWLAYPRYEGLVGSAQVAPEAFPSGHATAAMSLALAGVLVAPRRARPAAAVLGGSLALGVSFSVVSLGWHFPSDVVGGFLLASGWTLVVVAALRAAADRWPERSGRTRAARAVGRAADRATTVGLAAAALAVAGLALLVASVVLVARLPDVLDFAARHTALVVVGAAVAAAAGLLLAGMTLVLRGRG